MSKVCLSCGNTIEDDSAMFCFNCGKPLAAPEVSAQPAPAAVQQSAPAAVQQPVPAPAQQSAPAVAQQSAPAPAQQPNVSSPYGAAIPSAMPVSGQMTAAVSAPPVKKSKGKLIAILCAAAVVVIGALAAIFIMMGSKAYMNPIRSVLNAVQTGDYLLLKDALPENISEDSSMFSSYKGWINVANLELEREFGENAAISCTEIKAFSMTEDELKDAEKYFLLLGKSVNVTKGYEVALEIKKSGSSESVSNKTTVSVYLADGKWVLIDGADISALM